MLKGIIIHQKNKPGNFKKIKSKEGKIIRWKLDILQLKLFDGNYYDEILSQDYSISVNKPFIKVL